VLVADSRHDRLQLFASTGEALGVWGAPRLRAVAIRPEDDHSLTLVSQGDPRVHRVGADGSTSVASTPFGYRPTLQLSQQRVAVGLDGKIYLLTANTGELWRYGRSGELEVELRLDGLGVSAASPIDGLAVDGAGRLFVSRAVRGRLLRLSADGQIEADWAAAGRAPRPDVLAVGPDGSLYVGDLAEGRVERYSPDGSFLGVVAGPEIEGHTLQVTSIAVGRDGRLAIGDGAAQRLILIDGQDGPVATISAATLGLDQSSRLGTVALDSIGRILVAVPGEGLVLRLSVGA
jgi:sugar lactone lactonase YvrE